MDSSDVVLLLAVLVLTGAEVWAAWARRRTRRRNHGSGTV